MRKDYHQPATSVTGVVMSTQVLVVSVAAAEPGVSASREGYGDAIEETW